MNAVKIKIERSGGFGGIITFKEMNTDHLPSSVANTVKGIVERKSSTLTVAIPKGVCRLF